MNEALSSCKFPVPIVIVERRPEDALWRRLERTEGAAPPVEAMQICGLWVASDEMRTRLGVSDEKGQSNEQMKMLGSRGSKVSIMHDMVQSGPDVEALPVDSNHPLYILYTSGTTAKPKGVVRDHVGQIITGKFAFDACYGVQPGETYFAASDVGWVLAHSCIVYGPLMSGVSSVVYEGKPIASPDASAYWRVISEYKAVSAFIAPTALRAIRKEDPMGLLMKDYNLDHLRHMFVAGERIDGSTYEWVKDLVRKPICDNWWQTELGWPALCLGQNMGGPAIDAKEGSCGQPVPGWDLLIVDEEGKELKSGEMGSMVVRSPLPPGTLTSLYENDARFVETYFGRFGKEFYETGDAAMKDREGYFHVLSRTDDIINVAAHRLSTSSMEDAIMSLGYLSEAAVMGVLDDLKGQVPLAVVVPKPDTGLSHNEIRVKIVEALRHTIGAIACLKEVLIVDRLPKTRSGKILRRTMSAMADGRDYVVVGTIEDPSVIPEIRESFTSQLGRPFNRNGWI
eukprot:Filipodium_phascolosomae@DN2868_c0_g2_i1.p1